MMVREAVATGWTAPESAPPLVSVRNLRVEFVTDDGAFTAVHDVSFDIPAGGCLGIVGESGSGKSVSSLAIMGLLPPPPGCRVTGQVWFEGRDLRLLSADEMRKLRGGALAMIFQEPMTSLNPAFTIGDQIVEMIETHEKVGARAARARALDLLKEVRIPAPERRLDEYPHRLSGGMRQRVMIAMALACRPRLLIADEPTTALDVTIQAQILELLRQLQQEHGMSILLISHNLGVIAEIADEVAVMYSGRVVEHAAVHPLFRRHEHAYTVGLLGAIPRADGREGRLASIEGAVPDADLMPPGCAFEPRCPFAERRCTAEIPGLAAVGPNHRSACLRAPLDEVV
jgi:peptide/nickel transport system ATP-binding protein